MALPSEIHGRGGSIRADCRSRKCGRRPRAYGFIEADAGRLVSAKRYGALLGCRARFTPETGIEVTFPDRTIVGDDGGELSRRVSALIGHDVRLVGARDPDATEVVALGAPETLADFAPLHLLAARDLDALAGEHPGGEWDPQRFRPNVLIDDRLPTGADGWLGCDIHVGDEVIVHAVILTPRCVMTTHAQGGLPKDREILRTLTRVRSRQVRVFGERPCVGCYAEVVGPGVVRRGDPVRVERVEPRHGALTTAIDAVAANRN